MIRVGRHYVEPRRLGFFALEETALWLTFFLVAGVMTRAAGDLPRVQPLLAAALTAAALLGVALYLADLHDLRVALADSPHGDRLLKALGIATLLFTWAIARRHPGPAWLGGWGAACVVLLALRAELGRLARALELRQRIFLVGGGAPSRQLVREISREGGIELAGFAGLRSESIADRALAVGARTVVVTTDDRRGLPMRELLRCRLLGLEVLEGATFAARSLHRLPIELLRPSDLVFTDGFYVSNGLRVCRRALSVAVSLTLLILTAPLLVAAAIAVRFESQGPVLFRQARVGLGGRIFQILKFRTMRMHAERSGAAWATLNDPRVTRVGRILRRFRVDELPQLLNVLRGDMELCGPRPERPEFVAELREKIPYYELRSLVPPGITGWAQVRYPYAASIEESREKLQYDLYYVRHLSLSLDLLIFLATTKVVLYGRGAR